MNNANHITINVLTRTSNRPNGFKQCYDSVRQQTYPNVRHYVSYDNEETFNYISGFDVIPVAVIKESNQEKSRVDSEGNLYAPYNLYCNDLLEQVHEGWIMFLDDDDRLFHDGVLNAIVELISKSNEDTLYVGRMRFPNGKLTPSKEAMECEVIRLNDIGSPCVVFHSKYKDEARWDDYKRSDYRFIKQLETKISNIHFTNQIFAQINNFGDFGRQTDVDKQLPASFYKSKWRYYFIPKYHIKLGNVYIFHIETYKRFIKKVNLKLKTIFKF